MNYIKTHLPSASITVQSLVIKKGKPDIRSFEVHTAQQGDDKVFFFDKTMRDLTRLRFSLEEGCLITDDSGVYSCTGVGQLGGKRHFAIAYARRIA